MSNFDVLQMAVRNLLKRKLRTFLTILGVVVGTAAIVIMISLGIAMNDSFYGQVEQMGDITRIMVYDPNYYNSGSNPSNDTIINKATIEEFKKIKGVKAATAVIEEYLKFQSGKYVGTFSIKGIDPAVMPYFDFKLQDGRLLDEEDSNKLNLVFGGEIPFQFYNPTVRQRNFSSSSDEERVPDVDVLNDKIKMSYDYSLGEKNPVSEDGSNKKIKPYNVNCVGLLTSGDWENDYYVYMSITELEKIQAAKQKYEREAYNERNNQKSNGYNTAMIKCSSMDDVVSVQEEITALGYEAYSNMDSLVSMQNIAGSLQMLLGAIGAVSLLVAAIGITNTMIMAIYERTKEIGVMKVIGAQLYDIKRLFLVEAALIGFFGGLLGIVISYIVSSVLNNVGISFLSMISGEGSKISTIPAWLCMASLVFSSLVGLIAGYFPARRAMKLSALSAIRTE